MLQFYSGSGSPYAWRVALALEFKKIPYKLHMLSFSNGDHQSESYLAINPRGKVPAIVDDGFALYESAAILEYLDERYPDAPKLFPGDAKQRALIRRTCLEIDSYLAPEIHEVAKQLWMRPKEEWDHDALRNGHGSVFRVLDGFAERLRGDHLCGDARSAADLTLYPYVMIVPVVIQRVKVKC